MLVSTVSALSRDVVDHLQVRPFSRLGLGFGNYSCVANNSVGVHRAAAEFSGGEPS